MHGAPMPGKKMSRTVTASSEKEPMEFLRHVGERGGNPLDVASIALMLSALDHAGRALAPYRQHLADIAEQARAEATLATTVEQAARSLASLLAGRYGYDGDRLSYDDPHNADLISVIDRRRGLPVALGILYLHAARAAGYQAIGLNTPGHFLLKIAAYSGEALIDPFNGGAALDHEVLRAPPTMGTAPPSRPAEPVADIDVLLRLENNLKVRAIQNGERMRGLEVVKRMVLIAPGRAELWLDLGRLNEAAGALGAAKNAFETCLSLAPSGQSPHNEASLSLQALKRRLN
jgi:regulator of sirC expression with transglutaminase-like and TPR domain